MPKPTYPADHEPAMTVPKGGSCCSKCEYFDGKKCTNEYYIKWNGSGNIPAPPDEFCSDWFEPADDDDNQASPWLKMHGGSRA